MSTQKHDFAIFYQLQLDIKKSDLIFIEDALIYNRIVKILRLELNDSLILFNNDFNTICVITQINKRNIALKIIEINENKIHKPQITICISILKKEAFEESVYACVELGANIIQPIITQKVHRRIINQQELERLNKIIISAAEQSKNFNFAQINEPINFELFLRNLPKKVIKIFFDASGNNFVNEIENLLKNNFEDIYLMVGPEGDLNDLEKQHLKDSGFKFISLTPTILKSQTALSVGLGLIRSIFK